MPLRLRVLFVIGTLGGGGAERQVVEILKHLDRERFEPILYVGHRHGELLNEIPADVPIHSFWDDFLGTWRSTLHRVLRTVSLARWRHLARLLSDERIDVVYDRTLLATLDSAAACRIRPTRRVSCCVCDPELELRDHAGRLRLFERRFRRWAYSSASVMLVNSEGLRRRCIEFFTLPESHVRTLYNLVDLDRIERLSTEYLPDTPREPFLIVSSGRLHPQKGQRFLLEAVRQLIHERGRSMHLVVLGQGELESELRAFVSLHKLEQHVTLVGFVSNPLPWYKHAKLFVLPSLYEGLPNALIEAVACGSPVLATDCPSGPSEILDGGRCGRLIRPGDSTALADAIGDCMDHQAEWLALTGAARDRVCELCELKAGIRRLEDLLAHVACSTES